MGVSQRNRQSIALQCFAGFLFCLLTADCPVVPEYEYLHQSGRVSEFGQKLDCRTPGTAHKRNESYKPGCDMLSPDALAANRMVMIADLRDCQKFFLFCKTNRG